MLLSCLHSAITGVKAEGLESLDLEGEFDPNKFDQQMETVFNETYYEGEEKEEEKPVSIESN